MKPILIVYATREGHTLAIAEHIAALLEHRGLRAEIRNARDGEPLAMSRYAGVILAASVHMGRHEKEMVRFVVRYRDDLERLPTAFLSVSLAEASVEDQSIPEDRRTQAAHEVARWMDDFFVKTGWHPDRARPVAGALLYSEYNLLVRRVMKRIARANDAPTDTSRDYVFTDWEGLDRFIEDFTPSL